VDTLDIHLKSVHNIIIKGNTITDKMASGASLCRGFIKEYLELLLTVQGITYLTPTISDVYNKGV